MLLLLLQITLSSGITFNPATDLVTFSVEINLNRGRWNLQTETVEATVPAFSTIRFNPISLALWPRRYSEGAALILIKACENQVWRVILQTRYFPIAPTIVPGYEVKLKQPCDSIQLEVQWMGTVGANFEIQGTAALE